MLPEAVLGGQGNRGQFPHSAGVSAGQASGGGDEELQKEQMRNPEGREATGSRGEEGARAPKGSLGDREWGVGADAPEKYWGPLGKGT